MKVALVIACLFSLGAGAAPWAVQKPKLVVVLMIDQFRADYISRFQSEFVKDGFRGLIDRGAYYPLGEYDVLQSMTAPGHATVLTGAYPYQMGIPINEWFDQKLGRVDYCVEDVETQMVGVKSPRAGASPRKLVGDTVGDELKNAGWPGKVVSLAIKDRAAVLMGGHRPDLAFWFDRPNRQWSTSTYYRMALPAWMNKLNLLTDTGTCDFRDACAATMTLEAAEAAIEGEKLGTTGATDLIAIGFSGHDFAGHRFGPNANELREVTLAEDRAIARLRQFIGKHVRGGLKNVTFVLSGDHGVAPTPAFLKGTGIPSDNIDERVLVEQADRRLRERFGPPNFGASWIAHVLDFDFWVDERNIAANPKVTRETVEQVIKSVLLDDGRFAFVLTRTDYEQRRFPPGMIGRKAEKTYYPGRSGLVIGVQKPFHINKSDNEASHMTGYTYDRTVPIVFSGFGIRDGLHGERAEVVDIAPTLAFIMGLLPPALSEGHVLTSALSSASTSR